ALIRSVIGYAVQRFHATMPDTGSAIDQLRAHLQALRHLLDTDQELWTVMGELVLRAPRDAELAHIFRQTDQYWHRMLADLIQGCIAQGAIDAQLNADDVAALMIVAIKGLSLPTAGGSDPERTQQVFRQFERLLGLSPLR